MHPPTAIDVAALLLLVAETELRRPGGRQRLATLLCRTRAAVVGGRDCCGDCGPKPDTRAAHAISETADALGLAVAHVDFLRDQFTIRPR